MTQAKPKVIVLEQAQAEGCCEPGCGPETCGSVVEPKAELETQKTPVVAGGIGEGCCEPGCSPETCGS